MARTLTNNTTLAVTIESSIGVAGTAWENVEFDNLAAYGSTITVAVRRPISKDRGRKKGTVVDLDSAVEIETDLTIAALLTFAEGFMFAEFANVEFLLYQTKMEGAALDTDTTGDTFDFSAALSTKTNGTLFVSKATWTSLAGRSLYMAKGYANAANNGLHEQAAAITGASTGIPVTTNLVTETAPANATVELCGVRVSDGDLSYDNTAKTLTSAGDVTNWATLGVQVGQLIHIGSPDSSGVVQNALNGSTTDDTFGYARVTAIAGGVLTLDKLGTAFTANANNTGEGDADVMFGPWLRNVATTLDADDSRYLERSYQFEAGYPTLGTGGVPEYEYAIGNFVNEFAFNLPLTDKATLSIGFIGTNTEDIVVAASRKTGASSAKDPLLKTAFGTSSDLVSITTDVVSLASDVCFKSLTMSILNNVSPEKCLGTLGAVFVNAGLFEANLEGQMLFTNKQIVNAIKNNTTVTFNAILRNGDGAVALDIPELTLGGGDREFPVDQSVLVNITGTSFTSSTYGYDLSLSFFAAVPGVAA